MRFNNSIVLNENGNAVEFKKAGQLSKVLSCNRFLNTFSQKRIGIYCRGKWLPALCFILLLTGCAATKNFDPKQKYSSEALKSDYTVFRNVLEENHPGLYWYTTKDSLDYYFNTGCGLITDSMTEPQFRSLLSYVISKINCGHTTVKSSRQYIRHGDTNRRKQFPLSLKLWDDSAVVYANLIKNDTTLVRGTLIKNIDGRPVSFYRDSMFQFISADGYNLTHKYQTLSNYGVFGAFYRNIFGLRDSLLITYADTAGREKTIIFPVYDPKKDSLAKRTGFPKLSTKEKRALRIPANNNVSIDTTGKTALLNVNSFVSGTGFRRFTHKTFRKLKQQQIQHLIIDVRNNGGGDVGNSTLLTRYIATQRFKLADSLYAISKKSRSGKYINNNFRNLIFMTLMSKKLSDGKYHFRYFEHHYFKPKKRNHFNGKVYVLTGGNSFSATTLFTNVVKEEPNVMVIGEETGGGSYGNNAWLIPDVTLPITRVRFRLPKFRLVQNKNYPKNGRGIFPDIEVRPTIDDIRKGIDPKLVKALELIRTSSNGQ